MEEYHSFTYLQISLIKEESCIPISDSSFNLLQYIGLVEVYKENLALYRYMQLTKGGVL